MTGEKRPKFTIVGGGLAGGLMATYLGRAGYEVDVYEKRPDLREGKVGPGKSINLAVSARAVHALARADLADDVLNDAVRMRGRMMHGPDGQSTFQPYSKNEDECINSVSRGGLNVTLLNAAEACDGVRIYFNQQCTDVDLDTGTARFVHGETGAEAIVRNDVVIGADGAFSAVRNRMQRLDRFDYSQDYLRHGYKELCIPPAADGSFRAHDNALHIWPRRSFMMIALPNRDGSFTCTLFWPFDGPVCFEALKTPVEIEAFFKQHFPDAVTLMPTLIEDYQRNPVGSLVTVRCAPWHYSGRVALIGDAAHAVVPFYGQGINAGFEDCEALIDCISRHGTDLAAAFADYGESRKRHTDALADLAIANFLEMRDHVGSPAFLRKKRRERLIHRLFSRWYTPLYSMISFSRIPYADAVERAAAQDRLVRRTLTSAVVGLIAIVVLAIWLWS